MQGQSYKHQLEHAGVCQQCSIPSRHEHPTRVGRSAQDVAGKGRQSQAARTRQLSWSSPERNKVQGKGRQARASSQFTPQIRRNIRNFSVIDRNYSCTERSNKPGQTSPKPVEQAGVSQQRSSQEKRSTHLPRSDAMQNFTERSALTTNRIQISQLSLETDSCRPFDPRRGRSYTPQAGPGFRTCSLRTPGISYNIRYFSVIDRNYGCTVH